MSDATHRIEVKHDPHSKLNPWDAWIYRLSDDHCVQIVHGSTIDAAVTTACEWVQVELSREERPGGTYYVLVDDSGVIVATERPA